MATKHAIEYSKSSKAKCKGLAPCNGTPINREVLRYGASVVGEFGETVEWRHWGCVTPEILGRLAAVQLTQVMGFDSLRLEDQAKVRRAIASRRVDPSDIPASAKALTTEAGVVSAPALSQKKRKAAQAVSQAGGSSTTHASAAQPLRQLTQSTGCHEEEEAEESNTYEEESRDELYCMLSSKIVGVQYYKGMVGPDEEIRLIREPHNQYDRNAISVKNIAQTQIGHIPRDVAARMAPLMDKGLITVEGVMHEGNLSGFSYSLSMTLKFYGRSNLRDQLEPLLVWATPCQRGFPARNNASSSQSASGASVPYASQSHASSSASAGSASQRRPAGMTPAQIKAHEESIRKQQESLMKAQELKAMLNNLEKVDDEGRRTSLLDSLCSTDDILNLPLHPDPPGIKNGQLTVDLLKHQSQALQWCIDRECPVLPKKENDMPVQFWQMRRKADKKPYYYNIATKTPTETPPLLGRGALCADSMGLGKTLTMLSLIVATQKDLPRDYSRSTLIVVPLSVMSNWEKQIEDHCVPGLLTSCVYYGAMRSLSPSDLKKYDIVITTYQTVAGEHADSGVVKDGEGPSKKKKRVEKGLFDVQWKRIILDEGHTIRNPRTKMAKAVCALSAQRRWVLSGTPIINSPRDLGSMLSFLQICQPLDNEDFFKRLLLRPLKDGLPAGAELLRALMSHICIRRTKEMQDADGNHLVPLPPVEMILVPVTLDYEARELYNAVEEISKRHFERMMDDTGAANPTVASNVLSMLTRMRQLALHPGLVPSNYLEQLQAAEEDGDAPPAMRITPADRVRLQSQLAQLIEDCEECPICFSILLDPRITSCAHAFCLACITEVIARDPKCPMDRRPITLGNLIEPPPPTELTQIPIHRDQEEANGLRAGSSAKIDQLVHLLQLTPGTEKSLVFSQFTGFLDKIAEAFEEHGISYVRFDGHMSAKRRQETLQRFSIPLEDTAQIPTTNSKGTPPSRRRRRSSKHVARHGDIIDVDDADDDTDFTMIVADVDEDEFLDDDDNNSASPANGRKGKGKARASRDKPTARANVNGASFASENPKVMLISLKAGALGLNLTVANNVYLMDPWWQEGIESQAIDRCNRIGQKKPVHVYQLIAENTVEAKVIDIQEKKKNLITQAFAGIKRVETQRQKKEARLQDLIELFGIRQQAATQQS